MCSSSLQRNREAEESFRQAIENIEPLAHRANAQPGDRIHALQGLRERLGLLLHEVGRDGEAEELLRDVIKCLGQLVAEFPRRARYQESLVSAHINLGAVLAQLQRLPEAEEVSRSSFRDGEEAGS